MAATRKTYLRRKGREERRWAWRPWPRGHVARMRGREDCGREDTGRVALAACPLSRRHAASGGCASACGKGGGRRAQYWWGGRERRAWGGWGWAKQACGVSKACGGRARNALRLGRQGQSSAIKCNQVQSRDALRLGQQVQSSAIKCNQGTHSVSGNKSASRSWKRRMPW